MTTPKSMDVMCLGIFVADALGRPIRRIPAWRTLELIDSVDLEIGGCAANTGTGLARLGIRTGVMGKLGKDGFGDFIENRLRSNGLDTRGVIRTDEKNTSFTFVMIAEDGERAFFHYVGANGALRLEDVDFTLLSEARILHVAGSFVMPGIDGEPTAELLRQAKELGLTTCLDTVWNDAIDAYGTLAPSLPYLDYFLPSIDEATLMTGHDKPHDIAGFFMDKGVGTVGLKMGGDGSYLRNADTEVFVPSYKIDVIDTSGAGDSWIGGFLAGVSMGWDIERSARLGSACGALCCQSVGTTTGLRSMEETVAFMENTPTR